MDTARSGRAATSCLHCTPLVIGILMLMGIVTKNAIMLVDFAVEAMHQGVDSTTAIVEAGRMRARPIVMTTLAMTAGMLPSAFYRHVPGLPARLAHVRYRRHSGKQAVSRSRNRASSPGFTAALT
jgi:hypothetical protein